MKLSIVIPAYNEEKLISRCIESVLKAKEAAKNHDVEIIVVDNASTDNTAEVAKRYPGITLIHESRKGITRARQAGFAASHGEIVGFVDSDAYAPSIWITRVAQAFEKDPLLAAYGGPQVYVDVPAYITYTWDVVIFIQYLTNVISRVLFRSSDLLTGTGFAVRRSALEKIGGFDTNIDFYGEDADSSKRLAKAGRVRFSLRIWVYGSGRRIYKEGLFTMMWRYSLNALSVMITGKPATKTYIDIRE